MLVFVLRSRRRATVAPGHDDVCSQQEGANVTRSSPDQEPSGIIRR